MNEDRRQTLRRDLTEFQLRALGVLADKGAVPGLRVKEDLETYYGEEINDGRLYPNLDELVSEGLIEKGKRDGRTNEYQLTPDGEAVVREQFQWFRDVVDQEFAPTETAVADGRGTHKVLNPAMAEEIDSEPAPETIDADELIEDLGDGGEQP